MKGSPGAGKKRDREKLTSSGSPLFGHLQLFADKYTLQGDRVSLGGGTYGTILVARSSPHTLVACKRLDLPPLSSEKREGRERFAGREIKALKKLKGHVNIIELLDVRRDDRDNIYLVFPLVAHDLLGLIHEYGATMPPGQIKGYVKQLFEALQWCHSNNVMHRDVKPENVLVTRENVLKLADFGLAREYVQDYRKYTTEVQTRWYRAPELCMKCTDYGPATDMWAAGCVMSYCMFVQPLFPGEHDDDQLRLIYALCGTPRDINTEWPEPLRQAASKSFRYPISNTITRNLTGNRNNKSFRKAVFTSGAVAVLEAILQVNPCKRPSWTTVLTMPYFTEEHPLPYEPSLMVSYQGEYRTAKVKNTKK
jgi:serine/threonine protein kinase